MDNLQLNSVSINLLHCSHHTELRGGGQRTSAQENIAHLYGFISHLNQITVRTISTLLVVNILLCSSSLCYGQDVSLAQKLLNLQQAVRELVVLQEQITRPEIAADLAPDLKRAIVKKNKAEQAIHAALAKLNPKKNAALMQEIFTQMQMLNKRIAEAQLKSAQMQGQGFNE